LGGGIKVYLYQLLKLTKMKRIATCLTFLFLAFGFISTAQEAKEKQSIPPALEMKGTYQVQFLKDDSHPISITQELLEKIEQKRDKDLITYLSVNPTCRIKILPRQKAADFKMEEYIVLESFRNDN
jgi:hypothetical protein